MADNEDHQLCNKSTKKMEVCEFWVLMVVAIKKITFWDVMPCSQVGTS
jgi:hypothetical protein